MPGGQASRERSVVFSSRHPRGAAEKTQRVQQGFYFIHLGLLQTVNNQITLPNLLLVVLSSSELYRKKSFEQKINDGVKRKRLHFQRQVQPVSIGGAAVLDIKLL